MSNQAMLIEILDGYGRVQRQERFDLGETGRKLTIGRSVLADVTLDDPYVAPLHTALEITPDGRVLATDLGSVNGLIVGGKRHHGALDLLCAGNTVQVGRTHLRMRTEQEILAPEAPDQLHPTFFLRDPKWVAALAALACGALLFYSSWLGAPRDLAAGIVGALITSVMAIAAWVGFWGLLSRLMKGDWRWAQHAAIILSITAIYIVAIGVVDLGWVMFALAPWDSRVTWLSAAAFGCALYFHLTRASNLAARTAAVIACILPMLFAGSGQWLQERNQSRNVNFISGTSRIYPPSLRLRRADTVEDYFKNAEGLRQVADRKLTVLLKDIGDDLP